MTTIPREVSDLILLVSALREAQRKTDGNEIRKLQALIDDGLASLLPGLEAGRGAIQSAEETVKQELLALATEALDCLKAQARYFSTRGNQELRECKDRERRLNQKCRAVLDRRPRAPSLFGTLPEKAGAV